MPEGTGPTETCRVPTTNAAELRQATLLLRRVAQGEADVRKGRTVAQEKVFKALRARLAGK